MKNELCVASKDVGSRIGVSGSHCKWIRDPDTETRVEDNDREASPLMKCAEEGPGASLSTKQPA